MAITNDITLKAPNSTQATESGSALDRALNFKGGQSTQDFTKVPQGVVALNQKAPEVVSPVKVAPAPVAVDKFGQMKADLEKAQTMLDEFSGRSSEASREGNAISQQPDEVIDTPVAPVEEPSVKEQLQARLNGELDGSTDQSRATLRAEKEEEQNLVELGKARNQVKNELSGMRLDFEEQMEDIERNREGLSRSASNGRKNKLTTDYNRSSARATLRYHKLNEDFTAAQNTVDTFISDLKADEANEIKTFQLLMSLEQNDMTDSEKLQAQQAFAEKQAETSFQNSKDLAQFTQSLKPQAGGDSLTRRAQLIKLAQAGDPQSIAELGYDPNNMALSGSDILNQERTNKELNEDLEDVRRLAADNRAIEGSTGVARGGLFTSLFETGVGSEVLKIEKEDFFNTIKRLTGAYTLDNLIEKKNEGATFGALGIAELKILSASASELNALIEVDAVTGEQKGLTGSENALRSAIAGFENEILDAIDLNNARLGLDDSEIIQINQL